MGLSWYRSSWNEYNISVIGSDSSETTSTGATNGPLGSADAKFSGWPSDVMETRVLRLALPTANYRGGLALLWYRFYW